MSKPIKKIKIETSELSGSALDYAVSRAVGRDITYAAIKAAYHPSCDWKDGGPLIAKFASRLSTNGDRSGPDSETGNHFEDMAVWSCCVGFSGNASGYATGKTALIAACRAIVNSVLGDEVDVPEELCGQCLEITH